ncbi:MAG: ABC transporter permease [Candidatus Eremiobacteraeota bacterium]|nr:ABC transporter permease [Candidatus Eremiobacteraeota bacterium]
MGGVMTLFIETLFWILRLDIRLRLTVQQMAILGVNSIFIVAITTCFAGAVISLQLANLAVRYGLAKFVGGGVGISMAREFAPMLTAIVVAGRAGSAITAEIGSMKVTEQIDALEAMATSPVKYLVVPRFIACLTMLPILTLFANIAGVLGGSVVASLLAGITPTMFYDSIRMMVNMNDFWGGIHKSLFFAAEVAMISCYQGLTTKGGAAGVGIATTGSVVFSMIVIFITNYFLSAWLFPPI